MHELGSSTDAARPEGRLMYTMYIQTNFQIYNIMQIHSQIFVCTYIYVYINTYIHTYIYIHVGELCAKKTEKH